MYHTKYEKHFLLNGTSDTINAEVVLSTIKEHLASGYCALVIQKKTQASADDVKKSMNRFAETVSIISTTNDFACKENTIFLYEVDPDEEVNNYKLEEQILWLLEKEKWVYFVINDIPALDGVIEAVGSMQLALKNNNRFGVVASKRNRIKADMNIFLDIFTPLI